MPTAQELMAALKKGAPYTSPTNLAASVSQPKVTMPDIPPSKIPTQGDAGAILAALQAANPSGIRTENPKWTISAPDDVATPTENSKWTVSAPKYAALPDGVATPTGARRTPSTILGELQKNMASRTPSTILGELQKTTPSRTPSTILGELQKTTPSRTPSTILGELQKTTPSRTPGAILAALKAEQAKT